MARKKASSLYGYKHVKRRPRKRPGRHAKSQSKRIPPRKPSVGQGK